MEWRKINGGQFWEKYSQIIIHIACIAALALILLPILWIAQYNYPSADDWSLALNTHRVVREGGNLFDVLKAALESVRSNYFAWEGRYSSVFFASLQPGIWGEKYYGLVTWLMLGALLFSELFLCKSLLCDNSDKKNRSLYIPVMIPGLILQILYTPYPEESLYWYTGSVNYTFVYGLSLILIALFIVLARNAPCPRWRYGLRYGLACILAILVGGNNFATSLSCFLTLAVLTFLLFLTDRKSFFRMVFIALLCGAGLLICVCAPANQVRVNANFMGKSNSAVWAIGMSLVRSFTNIYSWTNMKICLMIAFVLPFLWKLVKDMKFRFQLPALFTLITFGLYASQATATMYIDGTTGGGRMGDILYYSYYVWVMGNVCYWMGWLTKHCGRFSQIAEAISHKFGKYLLFYCAVIGISLAGIIYFFDLHETTTYRAYRNWRQGWAEQYASEWEERIEILRDDTVQEVYFAPLSVYPEMLMYVDLQPEDGFVWVNDACALYYEKKFVKIKSSEQ